jgi:hypothetical protein
MINIKKSAVFSIFLSKQGHICMALDILETSISNAKRLDVGNSVSFRYPIPESHYLN